MIDNLNSTSGCMYIGMMTPINPNIINILIIIIYYLYLIRGYKFGPPLPVAPINSVRKVVEYAVTEIDPKKLNLGIPNYGYDWPLPFERGVTVARTIGNIEAVQIAIDNDVAIQYDELAQSPFFTYVENGIDHIVWFEDIRSLNAKFNLIEEFNLMGAGYWTIMQWFRPNWELISYRFKIQKKLS